MNPAWLIPTAILAGTTGYIIGVIQENWRPGVPRPQPGDHRPPRTTKPKVS